MTKRKSLHNKHRKKIVQDCYNCMECCPIGEGDHFCSRYNILVIEGYIPNENYLYCKNGKISEEETQWE